MAQGRTNTREIVPALQLALKQGIQDFVLSDRLRLLCENHDTYGSASLAFPYETRENKVEIYSAKLKFENKSRIDIFFTT